MGKRMLEQLIKRQKGQKRQWDRSAKGTKEKEKRERETVELPSYLLCNAMAEQSKENKKKRSAARDEGHSSSSSSSSSTEDPLFFQLLLIQLHLLPLPILFLLLLLPSSYQSPMCYVPRVECLVNNTFVVSPSPSPSFLHATRVSTVRVRIFSTIKRGPRVAGLGRNCT